MCDRIYTIDEIKAIAGPIAKQYDIDALYLFGSYARGSATSKSDIDFHVEKGSINDLFELGGLYIDLEDSFEKKLDMLTTQMLSDKFLESIRNEEVLIYAKH